MSSVRLAYRLLFALDIERYSIRNVREQLRVQQDLRSVLELAAARADLDNDLWHHQVRGDGELCVLPAQIDILQVVGSYMRELGKALYELNRVFSPRPPLRLRLALHHGTLTAGPFGPAGDAPIVVSRLLDAPPLRRHLAERQEDDLALVVSDSLFQDVIRTGLSSFSPTDFRAVRVRSKGISYRGHIYRKSLIALTELPQMDSDNRSTDDTNVLAFSRAIKGCIGAGGYGHWNGHPSPVAGDSSINRWNAVGEAATLNP